MKRFTNFAKYYLAVLLLCLVLPVHYANGSELQSLQNCSQSEEFRNHPEQFALLIRHALAPGTGDPIEFTLDDCSTQRNLDETGQQQAGKIGRLLRQTGFDSLSIFSSQWCRCRETAKLLAEGWKDNQPALNVMDLPIINSFFQAFEKREQQTDDLKQWLLERSQSNTEDTLAVLITHQVNITALTNVYPSSGEVVIVRANDGAVEVVGTLETL